MSGWRRQEALKLEWRDAELKRDAKTGEVIGRTITLRPANNKTSKHAPRMRLELVGELIEIVARALPIDGAPDPATRIFLRNGEPIGDFRKAWLSARKAIKRPGLLIHDMRRSAVRTLVRAGIAENTAMKFTRPVTRSIFERYDVGSRKDMLDAGAKLTEYLREQEREPVAVY